jgi:hypothetical protein
VCLGRFQNGCQDRDYVLGWFGIKQGEAKKQYQQFVKMDLIPSGSRAGRGPKYRAKPAIKLVTEMGLSMAETGRQSGLSTSGVAQILRCR